MLIVVKVIFLFRFFNVEDNYNWLKIWVKINDI